jgi:hypothetical protein
MRKQTPAKKTTVRKRKSNSPAKRSRRVRYHTRHASRRVNLRDDSVHLRIPIWLIVGAVVLLIALFTPIDVATRLSGALLQFADWLTHRK